MLRVQLTLSSCVSAKKSTLGCFHKHYCVSRHNNVNIIILILLTKTFSFTRAYFEFYCCKLCDYHKLYRLPPKTYLYEAQVTTAAGAGERACWSSHSKQWALVGKPCSETNVVHASHARSARSPEPRYMARADTFRLLIFFQPVHAE